MMPGHRPDSPTALVVGSGIAGVCAALFIQKTGARVAIVDANEPGTGASFGNAGIVVNTKTRPVFAGLTARSLFSMLRDPASPLNVRWSQFLGLSPWFMRMLRNANAADVQRITQALSVLCRSGEETYAGLWRDAGMGDLVRARGNLALNRTVDERDRDWDGPLAAYRAAGVPMEKVDGTDLQALAPVGTRYAAGVYSPDFQHTSSPVDFVATLFRSFLAQGGTWVRASVEGVVLTDGKVSGLRTPDGVVAGGSAVLAAGTGTARLAAAMGEAVPHQAVGGYHVMLASAEGGAGHPAAAAGFPLRHHADAGRHPPGRHVRVRRRQHGTHARQDRRHAAAHPGRAAGHRCHAGQHLARVPVLPAGRTAGDQRIPPGGGAVLYVRLLVIRHDQRGSRRPCAGAALARGHAGHRHGPLRH